jgi:hypothetical protein
MAMIIKLSKSGMREMLSGGQVASTIASIAEAVGNSARSNAGVQRHDAEIKVETYTTDRAAAAVLIKHPIGMGIQAKYGTLTQAAAGQGLQVRSLT